MSKQLEHSTRIDIVWDTYQSDSLKESTRELFALLTSKVASFDFPPHKTVYVTSGLSVISTMSTAMVNCRQGLLSMYYMHSVRV